MFLAYKYINYINQFFQKYYLYLWLFNCEQKQSSLKK